MIVTAKSCWDKAKDEHAAYFDTSVKARLKKHGLKLPVHIVDFLKEKHDQIRDGGMAEFRAVQASFATHYKDLSDEEKKTVAEVLPKIYCYDTFSTKSASKWCAYKLCQKAATTTCPYCNLSYGHTLFVGEDGKLRPTLDHYFDKKRFPLFAISLGNLIPSCYHCNSSLKGTADFFSKPHMHPLECDEMLRIVLDVDPILVRSDVTLLDTANIKIHAKQRSREVVNSLKTFLLEERYQFHVSEARGVASALQIYGDSASVIPGSLHWILQGVLPGNYRNRIMGKMILDLFEEYGGEHHFP